MRDIFSLLANSLNSYNFLQDNRNLWIGRMDFFRKPIAYVLNTLWFWIAACVPTGTATPISSMTSTAELGEPLAIITQLEGAVFIDNSATVEHRFGLMSHMPPDDEQPAALEVIRNGTRIRVEEGGSVTIVCFNNRVYRVTEQGEVTLTPEMCERGTPVPNSRRRVQPDSGRIRSGDDDESLTLQEEIRNPLCEYNPVPVILSPLDTHLLNMQPMIQWIEVADAIEYILELSSSTAYSPVVVDLDGLSCVENEQTTPNRICSYPWPETWVLAHGQRAFLTVSARTGIASKPQPSEKSSLRTLSEPKASEVQSEAEAIQSLDLDPVTHNLLLAGLYREHQLYDQALTAYEQVTSHAPLPIIEVTRGDLYRQAELPSFALNAYEAALKLLDSQGDDVSTRAAANFGMGAVQYNCQRYDLAEPHFVQAIELYEMVGSDEGLDAARGALTKVQERLQ